MKFPSTKMQKSLLTAVSFHLCLFLACISLFFSWASGLPIPPEAKPVNVIDPSWPPGSILKNLGDHYGYFNIPEKPPRGGGEPVQVSVIRFIALQEEARLEEELRIENEKRWEEEEEKRLEEEQRIFEEQQKALEEGQRALEQEHHDRVARFDEWDKQGFKKNWRKQIPHSKTPPPGYELQNGKWVKSVEVNAPETGDVWTSLGYETVEDASGGAQGKLTSPYLDPNSPYLASPYQVTPPAPVEENWEMVKEWKTRKEIEDEAAIEAAIQSAAIAAIAATPVEAPKIEVKEPTYLQRKAEIHKSLRSQIRENLREWRRTHPKTSLGAIEEVPEEDYGVGTTKTTLPAVAETPGTDPISLQQPVITMAPLLYAGPESDTGSEIDETEYVSNTARNRLPYAESESDLDSESDSEPDSESESEPKSMAGAAKGPLLGSAPGAAASSYTGSDAESDKSGPYDDISLSSSLSSPVYLLSGSAVSSDLSLVEPSVDENASLKFPSSEELNTSPSSPISSSWADMTTNATLVSVLTGDASQEKFDGAKQVSEENPLSDSQKLAPVLIEEAPKMESDRVSRMPGAYPISEPESSKSWEEVVVEDLQKSTPASYKVSEFAFEETSEKSYSPVTPQSIAAADEKTDGSISPSNGEKLLFENNAWDTPKTGVSGSQSETPVLDESLLLSHPGSPALLAMHKSQFSELPSSSEWASLMSSLATTPRFEDGQLLSPQMPGAWPETPRAAISQFDGVSRHAPSWSRLSESPSSSEWASMMSSLAATPQLEQGERVSIAPAESGAPTPQMPGAWGSASPPLQALPPAPLSPEPPVSVGPAVPIGTPTSGQLTPVITVKQAPEIPAPNDRPTHESGVMTPMRMWSETPSKPAGGFVTPLLATGPAALGVTPSRAQSLPGTPHLSPPVSGAPRVAPSLPEAPRLVLSPAETPIPVVSAPGTVSRPLPLPETPIPAVSAPGTVPRPLSPPDAPPGSAFSRGSSPAGAHPVSGPNSPAIVEADPENWPQSRVDPLSVVDKDDPLPTLRKWWENKETEREWEELNAKTGRNDGGSSTPAAERKQREAQAEGAAAGEGKENGGTGFRMSTPGTEGNAGGPTYPHPDSAAWKLFGGLTSDMEKKDKKGLVMDRLGMPARDKWGFFKWNLQNTAHGAALTNDAISVAGELLGGLLSGGRFGYVGPH